MINMTPLETTAKQLHQVSSANEVAEDPTVRPSPALARPPSHQGHGRQLADSTPVHTLGPSPPLQAPQLAGAADVTVVWTAEGLQRGVQEGARDIEIRAHLDMRLMHSVLPGPPGRGLLAEAGGNLALLHAPPTLRSIRVRPCNSSLSFLTVALNRPRCYVVASMAQYPSVLPRASVPADRFPSPVLD